MITDLKINNRNFTLGEVINNDKLVSAGFVRQGLLDKLISLVFNINAKPTIRYDDKKVKFKSIANNILYWASDCSIKCFNDDFDYFPVTRSGFSRDISCNTACYIELDGNTIIHIRFDITGVNNVTQAISASYTLGKLLKKKYGDPLVYNYGEPMMTSAGMKFWNNNDQIIVTVLSRNEKNVKIYWSLIES